MRQQIRFARAPDGATLAYATHGAGTPLVKAANWVTHLELDWESPLWRPWWVELARAHRVIRYDSRGCGLSDRDPERLTFDALCDDLEAVVDADGLERFALLGISQGGAVAIRYAVEHPERVSHLVLCGAYARGRHERDLDEAGVAENELLDAVVSVGWGRSDPTFRRVFTSILAPDATEEEKDWFDEMMRVSTTPAMAVRLRSTWADVDVSDLLPDVGVPTLVAHARHERSVPFEEGRRIAARIPDARLLPLETRNHVLLPREPAWQAFAAELHAFLGSAPTVAPTEAAHDLSARELEVLRLVADGLSNEQIAGRLYLSPRTVERHLSNAYTKLGMSGRPARAAAAALLARLEAGG